MKTKSNINFLWNGSDLVLDIKYRSHKDLQLLDESFFNLMNI
jgi:hypothetical protein